MRKLTGLALCATMVGFGTAIVTPASAADLNTSATQPATATAVPVAKVTATVNASKRTPADEPVTPLAGSARFTRGGLTCDTKWFNTAGSVNCFKNNNGGDPNQTWRAHYRCQYQSDFYSPRQTGPGRHGAECNFGIQGVDIAWG
jgi:hypothetical protein